MNKVNYLAMLAISVSIAACTPQNGSPGTTGNRLDNPLYLERYADNMIDRMVELKIQNDPLLQDGSKEKIVEDTRLEWLQRAKEARQKQREGSKGVFIGINEFAKGDTLYVDDTLYMSTTFETMPGPDVHMYLTTAVDPRDVEFPDATSVDLGPIVSVYGAQQMDVPPVENADLYRTAVIWDNALERLYGFAQLNKQ